MISLLLTFVALASSQESKPSAKPGWQRFRLDNGIAVSVLQLKDAPRQSSFSFLAMGLLDDARDRAQFSHLIEHMIIRSTDPVRLGVDGIMLNGETMGSTIRLESIAVPDKWEEALERHVHWLTVKTIDGTGIAKEKRNIAAEVENTVQRGYTHKWALAAWNQVIRHGKQHARVMGDVAAADPAQVVALLPRALALNKAHIYCVGPISAEKIQKLLRAAFPATVKKEGKKAGQSKEEAALDKQRPLAKKRFLATWDLQRSQLMLWFPMAGKKADEYLAAEVMAMNISMNLRVARKLRTLGVIALASVERLPIKTGEDRVSVLLSASCNVGQDPTVVEKLLLKAVSGLTRTSLAFTLMQLKNQSRALPDFSSLREQVSGPMANFLEANFALQLAYRELNSRLSFKDYARAIGLLDKERVMAVKVSRMQPELAYSLFLTAKKR